MVTADRGEISSISFLSVTSLKVWPWPLGLIPLLGALFSGANSIVHQRRARLNERVMAPVSTHESNNAEEAANAPC